MKPAASAASVALALALVACGTDTGTRPADSAVTDGVHRVGVDIPAGVYTTPDLGCTAYSASKEDFTLSATDDPSAFIGPALQVGRLQRIELHRGEYFTSENCSGWTREDHGARTPDPATLLGGCRILRGEDALLGKVLAYLRVHDGPDPTAAGDLQNQLMALVESRTPRLGRPAGDLVDVLDDPAGRVGNDGTLHGSLARSVRAIDRACARVALDD